MWQKVYVQQIAPRVGINMEVSKYAASGVPAGVTGGEQCMLLVCPYPGSPVAASCLSMLGCRGKS